MSYTQKILGEFISRIDTNEKYTRNELGKILTKVYHEIKNPKKPKRKTPFDFFIEQNREKIIRDLKLNLIGPSPWCKPIKIDEKSFQTRLKRSQGSRKIKIFKKT